MKPELVEAIRWNGENLFSLERWEAHHEGVSWDGNFESQIFSKVLYERGRERRYVLRVNTFAGIELAEVDDYVVRSEAGEYTVIQRDIFEDLFERVEEGDEVSD